MYQYVGNGRIKDARGKMWFFHSLKEKKGDQNYKVILAIADSWAVDLLSDSECSRYRTSECIEIPFKEIAIQKEPFFAIRDIKF